MSVHQPRARYGNLGIGFVQMWPTDILCSTDHEGSFMRRTAVLLISALALSGCGQPKLDGSSDEALQKSIIKVSDSLSGEKKEQFKYNVQFVALSQLNMTRVLKGEINGTTAKMNMLSVLDGKTADDVAAEAQRILDEQKASEREQAIAEIKELTEKQKKSDAAKAQLSKFTVVKSVFYLTKEKYSEFAKPIIELTVKNDTGKAISNAYFRGAVASPGRSVPWYVGDFNYAISGGLESGETATWVMAPPVYSDWAKIRATGDAFFNVEVLRVDGSDNTPLYDATGLTESERKRLQDLKSKYAGS
ncbi:DUF6694 family lipoprotein [Pseudomonas congelans]|uniref:DUF6694 family lipoprotein n=1 Tax=Pseudomonas congelans TaxID=200452 RepID=UPI00272CF51F|nr:DUF6694 family lipoprotein [Pseudomonas congelans]